MRILLIEDEELLGATIKEGLEMSRYEVVWEKDGISGLETASHGDFAVILLDIMLPGVDGWTVCERLRDRRNTTPILMMTARDSVNDRVAGLELGADDYLPKPFNFSELRARVAALIRRERFQRQPVVEVDGLRIDIKMRRVTDHGKEITLTPREFTLLEALARHPGQVFSQEAILAGVWGDDTASSNTVEVYISLLRKKIDNRRNEKLIHTIRNLGYMLRVPMSAI